LRTLIPFAGGAVKAHATTGFRDRYGVRFAGGPIRTLLAGGAAAARFLRMSSQPRIPSATEVADECVTVSYMTVALGCRLPLARILCCRMS